MNYVIEKGIPAPKGSANRTMPFLDMEVGDSVLIGSPRVSWNTSLVQAKAKTGRKFVTRTVEGGTRVWRIA